jgi:hypothetical protein
MTAYPAIPGPCASCGRADEDCCDHRGKAYCERCWHAARYLETPYIVVRDADQFPFAGCALLLEEAERKAAKMTEAERLRLESWRSDANDLESPDWLRAHWASMLAHTESISPKWRTYSAKPALSWYLGGRIAHPAYMGRRRPPTIQVHPEHGS